MGSPGVRLVLVFVALILAASALRAYQEASRRERQGRAVYFSVGSLELRTPGMRLPASWCCGCW